MQIGKTEKDEREEEPGSGLKTSLSFIVAGTPRALARMANLLKQGNVNLDLIIEATNAATDVEVKTLDLPHQMGLGETPVPPVQDLTANAGFPPMEEKAEPGTTPIRTGEPIAATLNGELEIPSPSEEEIKAAADKECEEAELRSREEEANAQFDAMPGHGENGNGDKPGVVIYDLDKVFEIKVPDKDGPYTITLDGCRKKSKNLISGILTVFSSKAIKADTAEMLIDTLLLYPQSDTQHMLIEVLRTGHLAEKQTA
jgi:hypothetical protein